VWEQKKSIMVVHSMNANGMTAGMQNSAAFSAGNLPESFDQYRPPAQVLLFHFLRVWKLVLRPCA
jgi:hypothetical protein